MILHYIAGLLTLPTLVGVYFGAHALFRRDRGVQCAQCGRVMGVMYSTPWIFAALRWKLHYLRYWYRTRPKWTCKPENGG